MTTRLRTLYIKVTIVHRQKEHVHAPSQSCIDISKFYPYVSGFSFSKLQKTCCKSGSEELHCLYFQLPGITIAEVRLPHQTILEDHTNIRLHVHQIELSLRNVMWCDTDLYGYENVEHTEITKHTEKLHTKRITTAKAPSSQDCTLYNTILFVRLHRVLTASWYISAAWRQ